jgi:hypothetical protein
MQRSLELYKKKQNGWHLGCHILPEFAGLNITIPTQTRDPNSAFSPYSSGDKLPATLSPPHSPPQPRDLLCCDPVALSHDGTTPQAQDYWPEEEEAQDQPEGYPEGQTARRGSRVSCSQTLQHAALQG